MYGLTQPELRDHQRGGIEFLRTRDQAILGDDPGLGKTRTLLEAAPDGRVLVVAPAMLRDVWIEERQRWRPDLDVTWVSYDTLPRRPDLMRTRWDLVIADEAHYIKGRKTQRTSAFSQFHGRPLWLATGTPVPNWAHELYIPLKLLHPRGDRQYSSYWRWVQSWFDVGRGFRGHWTIGDLHTGLDWELFYRGNHLDRLMRRTVRDAADLPPYTVQEIRVDMTTEQRRFYRDLKRDYCATVDDQELVTLDPGAKASKLFRCCTALASVFPEVIDQDPAKWHSGKLAALRTLLESRSRDSVIVWVYYRYTGLMVQRLAHELGYRVGLVSGANTASANLDVVARFKRGELDLLVGSIEVLAEGQTLTIADTCIFVERAWRPSRNDQAANRIYRLGQDRPVTVVHLITRNSLDERQVTVLQHKTDHQVEALRPSELKELL